MARYCHDQFRLNRRKSLLDFPERRLQNLVKTVKDGDGFDTRLNKESDPVGFYKLHGCIDHYTDSDIPLVLSKEQYVNYEAKRTRFYNRFRDLGFECPIIFAGLFYFRSTHPKDLV